MGEVRCRGKGDVDREARDGDALIRAEFGGVHGPPCAWKHPIARAGHPAALVDSALERWEHQAAGLCVAHH